MKLLRKAQKLDGQIEFNGLPISVETGRSRVREAGNRLAHLLHRLPDMDYDRTSPVARFGKRRRSRRRKRRRSSSATATWWWATTTPTAWTSARP